MANDFDSPTIDTLTSYASQKWTKYPGTIGAWIAEMDFGIANEVRDFIIAEAQRGTMGYLTDEDRSRSLTATSRWLSRFGWEPEPERMLLVPEVLEAMRQTIKHFTRPGSAVIIPTPAYMPFLTIPGEFGREAIQVPAIHDGNTWHLDIAGIERAFSAGAGLLVLCNPWNPTGRCLTREELEAVCAVVAKHDGYVFEDAVHASLILDDDATYIPYATINDAAAAHSITSVAASKGWNIPGLKCAQMVFNNPSHWQRFKPISYPVTEPTSTLGARAAAVCYMEAQAWNDEVRAYLASNRDLLEERVVTWEGVEVAHAEGTYISFLEFTDLASSGRFGRRSPATFIREEARVALTEGLLSGRDYATFARLAFATPRPILTELLDRIESALYR
ncbi:MULTISPECIES: aminotransferase class I/II-fold pyridoxal phosphate-dependent enzyme [unclassified Actinobaculum]|uniref:MalY/PatB family protein n=1 Tax=unclassified Actinobaculum TaxID=2609299 RepID=UPI000D52627E|nr:MULTISPECIES: aminotransferase class I/II-fold pyridoxal phosphate-dependent enzyme [unclassified Actinobaculum]AWE43427.1 hypothetical protein DDD63_04840 [Actinobaculum sp. 313]RTE50752.1 aminotransferase class I/II-fold pyridoxal phosphate-dependent enzyme [Actinobaculum sp. 352]